MKQLPNLLRHAILLGRQGLGRLWAHRLTRHLLLAALGLALLLLLAALGLIWQTYRDPAGLIVNLIERAGYEAKLRDSKIIGTDRIELFDLQVGDFLHIGYLEAKWSYRDLFRGKLRQVRIQNSRLSLAGLQRALTKQAEGKTSAPAKNTDGRFALELEELRLAHFSIILDNLGEGIPPIPLRLGEFAPTTMKKLRLGGSSTDEGALEERTAVVEDLTLWSPHDPLAPVLAFNKIEVAFSWQGIVRNELNRVTLENPVIYVGEDLFWFADQIKAKGPVTATVEESSLPVETATSAPWSIKKLEVSKGNIILTSFGQPGLKLPIEFEAEKEDLVLANFADLHFGVKLKIPKTSQEYPEYGLKVEEMEGEIFFNLPPGKDITSLTQAVTIQAIEWKGVRAEDIGVSMFFDKNVISAEASAQAYNGSATAWLKIDINDGFSWDGGTYASTVELETITRMLSPDNVLMKGSVSATIEAGGQSKFVQSLKGNVNLDRPGTMEIVAIDDVLQKLPAEWSDLKKQLSQLALGSMRDYHYTLGTCDFAYVPERSFLRLKLDSLQGKRNLDIQWLDQRENPGFGY